MSIGQYLQDILSDRPPRIIIYDGIGSSRFLGLINSLLGGGESAQEYPLIKYLMRIPDLLHDLCKRAGVHVATLGRYVGTLD